MVELVLFVKKEINLYIIKLTKPLIQYGESWTHCHKKISILVSTGVPDSSAPL